MKQVRISGKAQFWIWMACLMTVIPVPVGGGELADLFRKTHKPEKPAGREMIERFEMRNLPTHGVKEIGMERSGCLGPCPAYTVIIHSDGSVHYTGTKHVVRMGKHTGRLTKWTYNQLAEYVIDMGYADLQESYNAPVTDQPTCYTTAVINGQRKLVRNYADVGPANLWALQAAIDGVLAEVQWEGQANGKVNSQP